MTWEAVVLSLGLVYAVGLFLGYLLWLKTSVEKVNKVTLQAQIDTLRTEMSGLAMTVGLRRAGQPNPIHPLQKPPA